MAAYGDQVVCARFSDASEAVKRYQDMGCTVKRHSTKGTFVDCSMNIPEKSYFSYETARDEVWSEAKAPKAQGSEADASYREYFC